MIERPLTEFTYPWIVFNEDVQDFLDKKDEFVEELKGLIRRDLAKKNMVPEGGIDIEVGDDITALGSMRVMGYVYVKFYPIVKAQPDEVVM